MDQLFLQNYRKVVFVGGIFILAGITSSAVESNQTFQYHYVCPKNFESVGRKCYHFSNGTGTWFQAFFSCNDLDNSNLTVFTERYDQRQLEQYLFRNRSKSRVRSLNSYWVGGFKDWKQKKWIYTDGSLVQFPSLKDIDLVQEDHWTCLLIDAGRKRWRTENCMDKRPYICESKVLASVVLKVDDKKAKTKISIDECVSNTETLTKRQKRKCMKMLDGRKNQNNENVYNEPAAVSNKTYVKVLSHFNKSLKRRFGSHKPSSGTFVGGNYMEQPRRLACKQVVPLSSVIIVQKAKAAYPTQPTVVKVISHICPQNWMSIGKQCYLFSKEKVTWSEAHFNCGQINAKLAVIRSKVQDQKLRIFLNGFTEKQERWIGGRYNVKTKEWIWALNGRRVKYNGFAKEVMGNQTENLDWQAILMDPHFAYQWSYRNEMERHYYICQVKGRAVKRLNYPKRPAATIEILPDRRYQQRRNQERRGRSSRRANRNKRT